MNVLTEIKCEIVKGVSKSGNDYYALKVWITPEYTSLIILQNADKELVKLYYDSKKVESAIYE